MFEQILTEIVDEVALEGEKGCTLNRLFSLVEIVAKKKYENTESRKPLLFDDNYNAFIWLRLRNNDQLIFTENEKTIDATQFEFKEFLPRLDLVSVRAIEDAQDRVIYGNLKNEKKNLSDLHKKVLGTIAKSRSQGVSQFGLREMLGMDGKTVFHYLKKLDQLGLIVKEEVYQQGLNTRMIFLKKFASKSDTEEDLFQAENAVICRIADFKENVIKKLKEAPDNWMSLINLVRSLGYTSKRIERWARVRIAELHHQGVIEKFIAFDGKNKQHVVRLVQQKNAENVPENNQEMAQSEKHQFICRDLPIDYIFYQDLLEAGEKGLSRQDIINKYPFLDPVLSLNFFDNITIPSKDPSLLKYLVNRTEEFEGRTRQFRYYGFEAWQALNEKRGTIVPDVSTKEQTFNDLVEPTSIDQIGHELRNALNSEKRKRPTPKEKSNKRPKGITSPLQETKKQEVPAKEQEQVQQSSENTQDTMPASSSEPNSTIYGLKKYKKEFHDTFRAQRRTILLELVDKYRVCELSMSLYREFIEMAKQTSNTSNIARATFNRLVNQLHDEKQLFLFVTSIQKPSGLTEIKKIILHKSLTPESEQVKQFLDSYRIEKSMDLVTKRQRTTEIAEVTVNALPNTKVTRSDISYPPDFRANNTVAFGYGYIRSIWIRAKILQEAMFEFYQASHGTDNTIHMAPFLRLLPLKKLMAIYILPYDEKKLVDFLKQELNLDKIVSELPKDIKLIIYQDHTKLRRLIIRLLGILKSLGLVEPVKNDLSVDGYYKSIAPAYVLCRQGVVRAYGKKEKPVQETVELNTVEDLDYFWSELRACNTSIYGQVDADIREDNPLMNIWAARTWSSSVLFTPEQKRILDSFVDREAETVPPEDSTIRTYITKKTKLSRTRVKLYYDSIQRAFDRHKKRKTTNKKQSEREANSSPAINELMKASIEKRKVNAALFKMKQAEPFVEQTFVGSRKLRRLRLITEPYQGLDKIGKFHFRKRKLTPFSPVEKDALVHAYAIMRARADVSTFYWSPITKVLPNYSQERARRVFNHLVNKDPTLLATIEMLKSRWLKIYSEGIAKDEIEDERPWDTLEYDLPSYLEYFIVKLQDYQSAAFDENKLPNTCLDLHKRFTVTPRKGKNVNVVGLLDAVEHFDHLYVEEFDTIDTLPPYDANEVSIQRVISIIKMILITPEETYSGKDAYNLIKRFPDRVIEDAIEWLKSNNLVVRKKTGYSRIPGRRINVSEKFLNIAAGVLPYKFFEEASSYYNEMASRNSLDIYKSSLNSGKMGALLDLLSQDKLLIQIQDQGRFFETRKVLNYPRTSAVFAQKSFISRDFNLTIQTKTSLKPFAMNSNVHIGPISLPRSDKIRDILLLLQPKLAIDSLYRLIENHGGKGISWSEIVQTLNHTQEILADSLNSLLNSSPALVLVVGFAHLRYVSVRFASSWLLKEAQTNRYVSPLMWYDASGSLTKTALKGCGNAVMSHILRKPGISYAQLRIEFQTFFTEFELYSILQHLCKEQSVISRKIKKTTRKGTLFSKRNIKSPSPMSCGMNSNEITYYWLAPNYYLS